MIPKITAQLHHGNWMEYTYFRIFKNHFSTTIYSLVVYVCMKWVYVCMIWSARCSLHSVELFYFCSFSTIKWTLQGSVCRAQVLPEKCARSSGAFPVCFVVYAYGARCMYAWEYNSVNGITRKLCRSLLTSTAHRKKMKSYLKPVCFHVHEYYFRCSYEYFHLWVPYTYETHIRNSLNVPISYSRVFFIHHQRKLMFGECSFFR